MNIAWSISFGDCFKEHLEGGTKVRAPELLVTGGWMEIREVITGGSWMVMEPGVSRESMGKGRKKVVRLDRD